MLISRGASAWQAFPGKRRTACYLVGPIYTFKEDDEEFKQAIQEFSFPDCFYLPEDQSVRAKEGYIYFNQVQVIPRKWLVPARRALQPDLLKLVDEWFAYFLTGVLDDNSLLRLWFEEQRGTGLAERLE